MSSSESDDDCYGNIAQKLQSLKSQVEETLPNGTPSKSSRTDSNLISKSKESTSTIVIDDDNTTLNSTDNDELTLDAIIAQNTRPTKGKRGRKRKSANESFEPIYERETRSTRRKTANSRGGRATETTNEVVSEEIREEETTSTARRGRVRGRGANTPARGRRGNARGRTPRGRARRRGTASNQPSENIYPTFSIGNTDEYPDICDNQELFSTKPSNNVEIDNDDPLDHDNEELSVKVYWQSIEVVRFKVRKYQKLTPIFKYFSEQADVPEDRLLFIYNDNIIKRDDTPDSIDYSIAKFIEGGIVNQGITGLTDRNVGNIKNGLKIKFQCQNVKKPFETTLRAEDRLALAMMKYAEHLETPLERLRFYFDGDLLSSKSTPQQLDLEGGECIDVKIVS